MFALNHAKNKPVPSAFNVGLMSAGHFSSDFFCNVLPVLLPILAVRYGISYSQSAALFMVFSVSTNFLQPPIGLWADRHNLNYLVPLSIAIEAVFACAIGLADNIYALMFIILIAGVAASAFHPIAASVVYFVSIKRRRALCTSIFIAGGNFGFAVAPLVIAAVVDRFSDRYLLLLSLPAVIIAVLFYVRNLHVATIDITAAKALPKISAVFKSRPFLMLNTAFALRSWCYCALVVFLPMLLTEHGFSTVQSALALMILLLGTVVGGLVAGSLSDHFGEKSLILCSFVLGLAGLFFFYQNVGVDFWSLTLLFITGAGLYGSTPGGILWAQKILSNQAAFAASMMLGFTFGLGYILSVITGWAGDLTDLKNGMLITTVPAMAGAFVIVALMKVPAASAEEQ